MAVTAPAKSVVTNAMHEAIVLHGISYRELWEVQTAVEPLAARLAATNITAELLEQLRVNLDTTADCLDDPIALAEADVEFHDLVAQAAGNHALLLAREPLGALLFPAYGTVIRRIGPGRRLFEAHSRIFHALEAGDADTAQDWMTKHFVDFKRGCELAGLDLDDAVTADHLTTSNQPATRQRRSPMTTTQRRPPPGDRHRKTSRHRSSSSTTCSAANSSRSTGCTASKAPGTAS